MKIAVTMGDPAGIGPEIILKALPRFTRRKDLLIYASNRALQQTARDLGLNRQYRLIRDRIVDCVLIRAFRYGRSDFRTARAARQALDQALAAKPDILITAPIVKETIAHDLPGFTGHTEYLGQYYGVREFGMLGLAGSCRILLVTTHIPLSAVFRYITARQILKKLLLFDRELKRFFTRRAPVIAVSALNPHTFEFSRGEDERILRGVMLARQRGINAQGPFPSDSLFNRPFDGYLAMYHDQAMIYLKAQPDGLNITIGLPIIRLSPLYGAALDIAGQNRAHYTGLIAAVNTGIAMFNRKQEKGVNA